MKALLILYALFMIVGCSTTKYQTTPTLCPEAPSISLPEPPTAVTEEPAAENFLGRLLEQFGENDADVKR